MIYRQRYLQNLSNMSYLSAKFTNPYYQLVNPDDPTAILTRLDLENYIPKQIISRTTPNSAYGNIRKAAYDVGTLVNRSRAAAGASLNKYVSNPLRTSVLKQGLSDAEIQQYYANRYIGLPTAVIATSLGSTFVPGVGSAINKYIDRNLEYGMNHGFDGYLAGKGVNLGALKVAEGLGETGNAFKEKSLVAGESPDAIIGLGHKTMRRVGAAGVAAGGAKAYHDKKSKSEYAYMNKPTANFIYSEEGAQKGKEYAQKVKQVKRAQLANLGSIAGGVGLPINLTSGHPDLRHNPQFLTSSGVTGAAGGRIGANIVSDPLVTKYYELKGGMLGPEAIEALENTTRKAKGLLLNVPQSVALVGGVGASGLAVGNYLGNRYITEE